MEKRSWQDQNFERVEQMLAGPPGMAAFDFDNTLVFNDLGEACMYYIALQGLLRADRADFWEQIRHPLIEERLIEELRQQWAEIAASDVETAHIPFVDRLLELYGRIAEQVGLEAAYRWTRIFFGGHKDRELRAIASYVFEHEQERDIGVLNLPSGFEINTGIRVYQEIKDLIAAMVERDWDVRIVTASPEPLIRAVIHHWHLEEEQVRGMLFERDPENPEVLLPIVHEPMTFGPGKVARLEGQSDKPFRFAAGDSWTDFAMLLAAENALLIDRGSPELLRRAHQSGFWVQQQFAV